jgi:hypothetical protein
MIGYCPLDEEEPRQVVTKRPPTPRVIRRRQTQPPRMEEHTECNYAVLFFIVGVVVLALSDNVTK